MWDGHKADGTKVGGGIFKTTCVGCKTRLIAYPDVLEKTFYWRRDAESKTSN